MTTHSNLTFFDLETTDKEPLNAEILTGYFITVDRNFKKIDELYIESKPHQYKEESHIIHGISKQDAMGFMPKSDALKLLASYLSKHKSSIFICHANHLVFGKYGYFDEQVIRSEFLFASDKAYFWLYGLSLRVISTHTICKRVVNLSKYGLKHIADHFGIIFKHHSCKEDTLAMMEIFKRLDVNNLSDEDLLDLGHWKRSRSYENVIIETS